MTVERNNEFLQILLKELVNLPRETEWIEFKENKATYSPYESITGISSQRPELLLLSEFKPLFDENFKNQSKNQYS